MKDTLKWSYALNQWNIRLDVFVRHEEQVRAFKTAAACGFDHLELASGTGRWDNLSRPEVIWQNHRDAAGLRDFLARGSIRGISSFFWDPFQPVEEEGWAFRFPQNPADHDAIVESARPFIDFLAEIGSDRLVARPTQSAWMGAPFDAGTIGLVGGLWNRVGELAAASGVNLSIHYDCLSAIHSAEDLETFLEATDPTLVGLALDTAELTIGGIDPVAFYEQHADRVTHVHLKDTPFRDTGEEYRMPGAESTMLRGGAGRHIERWFFELGTEGGLVDVPAFVAALRAHEYDGWVVVESDHGGNPAELCMLNSWYLQHELGIAK